MSDPKTLFLLDAYALIYRSYYAFINNPRITTTGINTSATFGFCNFLIELLELEKPTHIAVIFDPEGPTFRHEMYTPYKAQRPPMPEDLRKSHSLYKKNYRRSGYFLSGCAGLRSRRFYRYPGQKSGERRLYRLYDHAG